jgi:hypothetical protein
MPTQAGWWKSAFGSNFNILRKYMKEGDNRGMVCLWIDNPEHWWIREMGINSVLSVLTYNSPAKEFELFIVDIFTSQQQIVTVSNYLINDASSSYDSVVAEQLDSHQFLQRNMREAYVGISQIHHIRDIPKEILDYLPIIILRNINNILPAE